ncbi:MAG: AbrB/MazE/SpoVT family DNA-binding domain-containing protein [Gammaproteobacteria bacterium]|nr:AbrB/MazE/SpoVT family DNA-binding domain-containing protein [Gammaproteobacteria bacterium]
MNKSVRTRDSGLRGMEALIRQEGDRLIIEPVPSPSLLAVLETIEPIDEPVPDIQDPLPEQVDL